MLSKNLQLSVPYAQNESCLPCKDGVWKEIKFEVETKFKMAPITNFVG